MWITHLIYHFEVNIVKREEIMKANSLCTGKAGSEQYNGGRRKYQSNPSDKAIS